MKDVALHKLSGMGKEKAIVDPISGKTANRMVYDTQLSLNVHKARMFCMACWSTWKTLTSSQRV